MSQPKPKRVYCVQRNGNTWITRNYTYQVEREDSENYFITDDLDRVWGYDKELFKIIE